MSDAIPMPPPPMIRALLVRLTAYLEDSPAIAPVSPAMLWSAEPESAAS